MRKCNLLTISMFLLLTLNFISCGSSSDDNDSGKKPEPTVSISVSDDVIGAKQIVEFTAVYNSDNPNILLTWFVDGEKQNTIPKSELTYDWKAGNVGEHVVEVAITDREQVLKSSKTINVVETEFGNAIIGDSKTKIARTYGASPNEDIIQYKESVASSFKYYFSQGKLYKIYYEYAVSLTPRNKTDYLVPVYKFRSAYERLSGQYGSAVRDTYSNLSTEESKLVEYGGHIYSGTMAIDAVFQNESRIVSIYVGPYKKGYGFTFTETLEKR